MFLELNQLTTRTQSEGNQKWKIQSIANLKLNLKMGKLGRLGKNMHPQTNYQTKPFPIRALPETFTFSSLFKPLHFRYFRALTGQAHGAKMRVSLSL